MKTHASKVKQSLSRKIVFTIAFVLFVLYTAYILFFFVFGILIALKADMQAYTADQINKRLFSWPEHPAWGNFAKAFGELALIDSKAPFCPFSGIRYGVLPAARCCPSRPARWSVMYWSFIGAALRNSCTMSDYL